MLIAATIPDYIAISVEESSFDMTRKALMDAGFVVSPTADDIWKLIENPEEPNEHRNDLYNKGRVRRGLKAV